MPNANERRALWFLALVALSGSVVRLARARHAGPPPAGVDAALERQIALVDSARAERAWPRAAAKPRAPSQDPGLPHAELVDLDRAPANELERLPGIGPALARRIVAWRDSAGAFGSLAALCGVRGIGPATAERLRPRVTFSGVRPGPAACADASSRRGKGRASQPRAPR